jgi:hypothetical protein
MIRGSSVWNDRAGRLLPGGGYVEPPFRWLSVLPMAAIYFPNGPILILSYYSLPKSYKVQFS